VHLYDPHDPYEPPPPYSEIYKDRLYDGEIATRIRRWSLPCLLEETSWYESSLIVVVGTRRRLASITKTLTHLSLRFDHTCSVTREAAGATRSRQDGQGAGAHDNICPRSWKCWAFSRRRDWMANHWGHSLRALGGSRTVFGETDYPLRLDGLLCGPSERKASSLSRRRSRNSTNLLPTRTTPEPLRAMGSESAEAA